MLQLSVVIPTLGGYELLDRVLAGLAEQDAAPGSFEVVVATDVAETQAETVERLLDDRPFAVRRVAGAVPGASANRNAGFAAARAPLVLFIDNDTIPAPGLVSEHLSWHAREPDETTGVLGLVRWAPELTVTTFMRWLDTGIQFDFANIEGTDAGWGRFVSANASVKRSFMGRVGGFDEQRFPYGYEDTDWAYLGEQAGLPAPLQPPGGGGPPAHDGSRVLAEAGAASGRRGADLQRAPPGAPTLVPPPLHRRGAPSRPDADAGWPWRHSCRAARRGSASASGGASTASTSRRSRRTSSPPGIWLHAAATRPLSPTCPSS